MAKLAREKKIAVSMIAGDEWDSDHIKTLLASIEPYTHHLDINYNGSKRSLQWGRWTSLPITYLRSKWEDDFAAARNLCYRAIPKDEYGWWMWIDTDDKLVAPDGFDAIWEEIDQYTRGVFLRYAYSVDPETGAVDIEQWRERLLSLDWVWQWKWPIHEVVIAPQGTQFFRADGPETGKVYIEHLRDVEARSRRDRNRRIIMKALKQNPDEPRYLYNFANECLAEADLEPPGPKKAVLCDAAIVQYQKFLQRVTEDGAGDDAYSAATRIGELFFMKADYNGAIDAFLQAVKFYPAWPEAYVGCAKSLMQLGDWQRMFAFADIAAKLDKPITSVAIEPQMYDYLPILLRGIARDEMGDLKGALKDYRQALHIQDDPGSGVKERIASIKERLKEKPKDPWAERKSTRGTRQEKSICFYTHPIIETWNQETLKAGGHGGAETLILQLAPMFAADGWRVSVYGVPGEDHHGIGDDGVEYWRSEEWVPIEPYTVFVSSRAATPFAGPIEAKATFLWMHDVNIGPQLRAIAMNPTAIVPISPWHKRHLTLLYGIPSENMQVIPNGVDISEYEDADWQNDGHKFVWSSSPDRGLDNLLAMWPMIKDILPDATLEVFYGWDFIDKLLNRDPSSNPGLAYYKMQIGIQWENLGGESAGLYWRGRVPPAELAKAQRSANIWAYPTEFMETFCLTAVQAQLSGMIPITSNLAALKDVVACDWLRLDGWPNNADYQSRFIDLIRDLYAPTAEAEHTRETARRLGRQHAKKFTLENAYSMWNDLFISKGVEV